MKSRNLLTAALLLISVISMIAISPLSNAQQTPNLSITPNSTQLSAAQVGTTINVNFTVSNVQNLFAWNLNLTWNPQVLNLTQIQEGPFLTDSGQTIFPWDPSSSPISRSQGYLQGVDDVLLSSTGVDGNGVLATITFKVLSTGTSAISIDGSSMKSPSPIPNGAAQNITATTTNGVVAIGTSNATPTPTSAISPSPTPRTTGNPTQIPPTQNSPTQSPTPTTPEFPAFLMLPLMLIIAAAILGLLKKTKINQFKP
jgi:hypothetical protein